MDLNWFAGVFEGEGTVTIVRITRRKVKIYTRALICLTSTDFEMVMFFQKRWPGSLRYFTPKTKTGNAKKAVAWTLYSGKKITRFIVDVLPFIRTHRVRQKMELVFRDIGSREQGARGTGYNEACIERLEEVQALNKRGIH